MYDNTPSTAAMSVQNTTPVVPSQVVVARRIMESRLGSIVIVLLQRSPMNEDIGGPPKRRAWTMPVFDTRCSFSGLRRRTG
jgi:hypothetical protein